jgi:hypothetical protein
MPKNLRVVGTSRGRSTPSDVLESMDQTVVAILSELGIAAVNRAAHSTAAIFQVSSNYVTKPAYEALLSFYELYFSKHDPLDQQKVDVNAEVDALFEAAVRAMNQGNIDAVTEDESKRQERLALAALQKRLEGLIVLDQGIKQEILPAIASMQFEDAVRQRLSHVTTMWSKTFAQLATTPGDVSATELATEMGQLTSSVAESRSFYRLVLGREAPDSIDQGLDQGLSILF